VTPYFQSAYVESTPWLFGESVVIKADKLPVIRVTGKIITFEQNLDKEKVV
jgi:hypothetical protein